MLKVTVLNRGEIAVFRCMGRMVAGEDTRALWDGVRHTAGKRLVVLDLAEVDAIDAAGLGLLVFLHTSASIDGMGLKIINPTERIRELLALTNLDSVLEICSPQDVQWRPSGSAARTRGENGAESLFKLALVGESDLLRSLTTAPPGCPIRSSRPWRGKPRRPRTA
jgi:anti-anti-sigma factor